MNICFFYPPTLVSVALLLLTLRSKVSVPQVLEQILHVPSLFPCWQLFIIKLSLRLIARGGQDNSGHQCVLARGMAAQQWVCDCDEL